MTPETHTPVERVSDLDGLEADDDHLPLDMALTLLFDATDMAVYAGAGSANVAITARMAMDEITRLRAAEAATAKAGGWQDISEHDNSRDPFIVEDKHGRPVVGWRHHPSGRTDEWLSIPGGWKLPYPKRFAKIPALPSTPVAGEAK